MFETRIAEVNRGIVLPVLQAMISTALERAGNDDQSSPPSTQDVVAVTAAGAAALPVAMMKATAQLFKTTTTTTSWLNSTASALAPLTASELLSSLPSDSWKSVFMTCVTQTFLRGHNTPTANGRPSTIQIPSSTTSSKNPNQDNKTPTLLSPMSPSLASPVLWTAPMTPTTSGTSTQNLSPVSISLPEILKAARVGSGAPAMDTVLSFTHALLASTQIDVSSLQDVRDILVASAGLVASFNEWSSSEEVPSAEEAASVLRAVLASHPSIASFWFKSWPGSCRHTPVALTRGSSRKDLAQALVLAPGPASVTAVSVGLGSRLVSLYSRDVGAMSATSGPFAGFPLYVLAPIIAAKLDSDLILSSNDFPPGTRADMAWGLAYLAWSFPDDCAHRDATARALASRQTPRPSWFPEDALPVWVELALAGRAQSAVRPPGVASLISALAGSPVGPAPSTGELAFGAAVISGYVVGKVGFNAIMLESVLEGVRKVLGLRHSGGKDRLAVVAGAQGGGGGAVLPLTVAVMAGVVVAWSERKASLITAIQAAGLGPAVDVSECAESMAQGLWAAWTPVLERAWADSTDLGRKSIERVITAARDRTALDWLACPDSSVGEL